MPDVSFLVVHPAVSEILTRRQRRPYLSEHKRLRLALPAGIDAVRGAVAPEWSESQIS